MLNKGERKEVLKVIGQSCTYGLLPAQVDLNAWELLPCTNWKSYLAIFLYVVNSIYKLGTLATAYFLEETPLHQIIMHVTVAIAAPVYTFFYYVVYIQHPGVFRAYLNMTLSAKFGEVAVADREQRSWLRRLKECTPQDWFALTMHYMLLSAFASVVLAFMCYPSLKLLLYASIPKEYQTWPIFCILLLEDSRFIFMLICIGIPVWAVQVISFELVNSQLQLMIDSMRRAARKRSFEGVSKAFRHIQLYVGIMNLINSSLIFVCKTLYITLCIITGYAGIAHFSDYPVFGAMYYLIFLNCGFIYLFVFGRAFKIPALFKKATQSALLHLCSKDNSLEANIFKRQMRSIPRVGVKVGEFHMMERESTIIFIDYVSTNIMGMLGHDLQLQKLDGITIYRCR